MSPLCRTVFSSQEGNLAAPVQICASSPRQSLFAGRSAPSRKSATNCRQRLGKFEFQPVIRTRHNVMVRVAVFVPLYEPEIVTVVDPITGFVVTVNVALVVPAGMVTVGGTLAAEGLLLERATCAPPAGAGAFRVTVPVEGPSGPPITLVGFRVSEDKTGGITVSVAVCVPPP